MATKEINLKFNTILATSTSKPVLAEVKYVMPITSNPASVDNLVIIAPYITQVPTQGLFIRATSVSKALDFFSSQSGYTSTLITSIQSFESTSIHAQPYTLSVVGTASNTVMSSIRELRSTLNTASVINKDVQSKISTSIIAKSELVSQYEGIHIDFVTLSSSIFSINTGRGLYSQISSSTFDPVFDNTTKLLDITNTVSTTLTEASIFRTVSSYTELYESIFAIKHDYFDDPTYTLDLTYVGSVFYL